MSMVQKMKEKARSEWTKCVAAGKQTELKMRENEYLNNCIPESGKEVAGVTVVGVATGTVAAVCGAGFFTTACACATGYVAGALALGAVKTVQEKRMLHKQDVTQVSDELRSLFAMVEQQSQQ